MYKGARYIAKQTITIKEGGVLLQGDILGTMRESEAIGRPDFEPVYDEPKKEKKDKRYKDIEEE